MKTMEMSEEEEDTVTMIIETTEDFAKKHDRNKKRTRRILHLNAETSGNSQTTAL